MYSTTDMPQSQEQNEENVKTRNMQNLMGVITSLYYVSTKEDKQKTTDALCKIVSNLSLPFHAPPSIEPLPKLLVTPTPVAVPIPLPASCACHHNNHII